MKVVIKVKFKASREKFENFGGERYLAYVPFEDGQDSANALMELLSRHLGVVQTKIEFIDKDINKNWVIVLN